jgi:predicted ribosome quality control (RQC) complex YloA/Tae2 family protein
MRSEVILIQPLNREITFYIGKNQSENFEVIDKGSSHDLWFHAKDDSSCHVICKLPNDINNKKDLKYLIKKGALLCKTNTNKLKNISNVEIVYTQIQNISKTQVPGCVLTKNTKTIVI